MKHIRRLQVCNPRRGHVRSVTLAVMILVAAASGCSPSISPLYRDYTTGDTPPTTASPATTDSAGVAYRLAAALESAGWSLDEPPSPNVLGTVPRKLNDWGLYRVEVSLEAAPLDGDLVRVYFHPYRVYFTGGRSKIPFLGRSLRAQLLPDLNRALKSQGLTMLGTPEERDEEVTSN